MDRQLKFRIWDKENNKFVQDATYKTRDSYWYLRASDGALVNFMCSLGGTPDESDTCTENEPLNAYWKGEELVMEPQYDIQQFTGILDTEGREIYEGDILQVLITDEEWLTPSVVVWSKYDEAGYSLANVLKIEDCQKQLIGHTVNGIELTQQYPMTNKGRYKIIGNVFENPELLK